MSPRADISTLKQCRHVSNWISPMYIISLQPHIKLRASDHLRVHTPMQYRPANTSIKLSACSPQRESGGTDSRRLPQFAACSYNLHLYLSLECVLHDRVENGIRLLVHREDDTSAQLSSAELIALRLVSSRSVALISARCPSRTSEPLLPLRSGKHSAARCGTPAWRGGTASAS